MNISRNARTDVDKIHPWLPLTLRMSSSWERGRDADDAKGEALIVSILLILIGKQIYFEFHLNLLESQVRSPIALLIDGPKHLSLDEYLRKSANLPLVFSGQLSDLRRNERNKPWTYNFEEKIRGFWRTD